MNLLARQITLTLTFAVAVASCDSGSVAVDATTELTSEATIGDEGTSEGSALLPENTPGGDLSQNPTTTSENTVELFGPDSFIRLASGEGGFDSIIDSGDRFGRDHDRAGDGINEGDQFGGRESAPLGDIDNDGTIEIAAGAFQSDGGTGAIWILSLDPLNFNVLSKTKIAPGL